MCTTQAINQTPGKYLRFECLSIESNMKFVSFNSVETQPTDSVTSQLFPLKHASL